MATFNSKDQVLLQEAYGLQLLKESFPRMTLAQVAANLDEFTLSESVWVDEFSNRVIEELFGGLKGLLGAGGGAAKTAGGGIGNAVKGAAQGVKNAAQGAVQGAKGAASKVGQNVKDIYNSAEDASKFKQGAKQAQAAALQLVELVKDAQQKGLVTFSQDPLTMPLGELVEELILAQQGAQQLAGSAQRGGVFKGAGKAFQKGFQS